VEPDDPVDPSNLPAYRVEHFPNGGGPAPWLDRPDARRVVRRGVRRGQLSTPDAKLCRRWIDGGYVIVENLIEPDWLDYVWTAYESSIDRKDLVPIPEQFFDGDTVPGRALNPHFLVPEIAELMAHPELVRIVELLLGAKSLAFQSISGHKASQQAIHSDSIHMTTYPQGYLVAMWIAFEDISPDSGPLVYYPGSHRLPYVYSKDVGIPLEDDRVPNYQNFDALYTPAVERTIRESGIPPAYFHARRGDVLFWHANLIHGGSSLRNVRLTRKALVLHYFAQGCVCYHDLSGGAAWIQLEKTPTS
jgi:ectoine hydroxylase-related dioxygenase (phytanoyl-CoA dioxygenase family)